MKIGLLGGSFNPAHEGHLYVSNKALEILKLDEIWWIVANQNPLKSKSDMASFEERFASAKKITKKNNKIIISDFEKKHNLQYSYDVISKLQKEFIKNKFVWLMGADNLLQFKKWHNWQNILNAIPIAILNRNTKDDNQLKVQINDFKKYQIFEEFENLSNCSCPCWC